MEIQVISEFDQRVEEARAIRMNNNNNTRLASDAAINDLLRRESITTMKLVLTTVLEASAIPEDSLVASIKNIRKSEYGKVPALINLLTKVYAWPITDKGDAKEIDNIQLDILEALAAKGWNLDHDLLLDAKESKGYHSFYDGKQSYELVDGVEPDFEEYEYSLLTIADKLGLPYVDNKLNETKWHRTEAKSQEKAQLEYEAVQLRLAEHKALNDA